MASSRTNNPISRSAGLLVVSLSLASSSTAFPAFDFKFPFVHSSSNSLRTRASLPAQGFYNPADAGGSMLTVVDDTFPAGLGEPLNVILSGNSDPAALLGDGFTAFGNSIGFGGECLGIHFGDDQRANLGDGAGLVNQTAEMREDFGDPVNGVCQESINGGNHFRYWVQNGTNGDSGAVFMAASVEQSLNNGHDIATPDGYDEGRDFIVGNATASANGTFFGQWSFNSTVVYVEGLLPNGSTGINHGLSIDGRVAVLTVKVTHQPAANSTTPSSSASGSSASATGSSSSAASVNVRSHSWATWSQLGLVSLLVVSGSLCLV